MKNRFMNIIMVSLIAGSAISSPVFAQTSDPAVPGHPRVNEIDQRLENQQKRIDNGVKDGQINAKQEMRDEKRDSKVSQELSRDEAKHNGHITKREQRRMNRQLNKDSHHIRHQRHEGRKDATK